MAQPPKNKPAVGATKISIQNDHTQVIYADRILNVGFGSSVSRLTLGLEKDSNQFTPFATLVVPTPVLIDAVGAMLKAVQDNDEMRAGLVKSLDAFKEKLEKIK